jgi:hypothetical protein
VTSSCDYEQFFNRFPSAFHKFKVSLSVSFHALDSLKPKGFRRVKFHGFTRSSARTFQRGNDLSRN